MGPSAVVDRIEETCCLRMVHTARGEPQPNAASAAKQVGEKVPLDCHSERSEESLLIENKKTRGILRANPALRMTVARLFPHPV